MGAFARPGGSDIIKGDRVSRDLGLLAEGLTVCTINIGVGEEMNDALRRCLGRELSFWARRNQSLGREAHLYAIVDAGVNPTIFEALRDSGLMFECLLPNDVAERMQAVAPYLVSLEQENKVTEWILSDLLPQGEGIAVISWRLLMPLADHARRFNMARSDGRLFYFKYFLPETLLHHFPHLSLEQRVQLFSDIDAILAVESRVDEARIHVFTGQGHSELSTLVWGEEGGVKA